MDDKEVKRLQAKKDRPLSALDRLVMGTIADDLPLGNADDVARETWPTVWDWLTRTTAGKNHVMQPARLTLSMVPGAVICQLAHKGLNYQVEALSDSLAGCFDALEKQLTSSTPGVRPFGRGAPKIKKRNSGT